MSGRPLTPENILTKATAAANLLHRGEGTAEHLASYRAWVVYRRLVGDEEASLAYVTSLLDGWAEQMGVE